MLSSPASTRSWSGRSDRLQEVGRAAGRGPGRGVALQAHQQEVHGVRDGVPRAEDGQTERSAEQALGDGDVRAQALHGMRLPSPEGPREHAQQGAPVRGQRRIVEDREDRARAEAEDQGTRRAVPVQSQPGRPRRVAPEAAGFHFAEARGGRQAARFPFQQETAGLLRMLGTDAYPAHA